MMWKTFSVKYVSFWFYKLLLQCNILLNNQAANYKNKNNFVVTEINFILESPYWKLFSYQINIILSLHQFFFYYSSDLNFATPFLTRIFYLKEEINIHFMDCIYKRISK